MGEVWPLMRNIRRRHRVYLHPGVGVLVSDDNCSDLDDIVARSRQEPSFVNMYHVKPGLAFREWVEGQHPNSAALIEKELRCLHSQYQHVATDSAIRKFYDKRRLRSKLLRIRNWPHWDKVYETGRRWVKWHGDPTLNNSFIVGGGIMFIDHAPEWTGPREYDYAKLRRSLILTDVGERCGDPDPHDYQLAAVVAGMIGSHTGPMRRKLLELWECFNV